TLGGNDTTTGLFDSDVFYFGSAVGDTGLGNASGFTTTVTDELDARNNPQTLLNNIPITNIDDFNRDGKVDTGDQLIARNGPTTTLNATKAINISGSGPFAPDTPSAAPLAASDDDLAADDGLAAISAALAVSPGSFNTDNIRTIPLSTWSELTAGAND